MAAPGDATAMPSARLAPLRGDFPRARYGAAELRRLRDAALAVLDRTGVRVRSEEAREAAAARGAIVDGATGLVRWPASLVLDLLAGVPRHFVLASRDGEHDLDLGSGDTYGTTDGCGTQVIDWHTGERRASTKADLAGITRLQDALPSVAFWWPTVSAGDRGRTAQLHELDAGWNNTGKHLQGMVQGADQARLAVEMARIVAGGAEELRRRPLLSDLVGTVSPLVIDRDGIEAAFVFAAAGVPVCFVSMPVMGTTAPASRAGAIVLGAAEVVAAAALVQCASPGAAVWGSIMHMYADPRTGAYVSKPLDDRSRFLATELLHAFGLSSMGGYGGTVSELADAWQSGAETAHGLVLAALDGCETFTGIGLTNTYGLFSLEGLLMDDDLYHRARHALLATPTDEAALALDVIDDVGPGGHFLGHRHTRANLRHEVVRALTQAAGPGETGPDGTSLPVAEVARRRAVTILENHEPPPLGEHVRRELAAILRAADAALGE